MKDFFQLREAVKSADKKPENYTDPTTGKTKTRMVPVDKEVVKETKGAPKGFHFTRDGKLKRGDADQDGRGGRMLRADPLDKQRSKIPPVSESYEDEMPASPDELSMALRQAKFIKYVGDEIEEYLEMNKRFPEWMQNKLSAFHQKAKDMHATMAGDYEDDDEDEMNEKTLTPAEKKKREEIAKAMERENPGMDMSKKMAIATAQAKKVAEEVDQIDEVLDTPKAMDSYRNKAKYSKERAANSAAAKMFRNKNGFHSTDTSQELDTMDKRTKGLKMADRAAARKYRQSLRKATDSHQAAVADRRDAMARGDKPAADKAAATIKKRSKGVSRAFGEKRD